MTLVTGLYLGGFLNLLNVSLDAWWAWINGEGKHDITS